MFKFLRNKKGVTLVELLAVVVILGIIAAIAVPTIGGLIERQQQKADIATLTNVAEAAKLYDLTENAADGIYLITDLDIDLAGNTIGTTSGATDITHVLVDGTTVSFLSSDDAADEETAIFVNTTPITVSGNTYTVTP